MSEIDINRGGSVHVQPDHIGFCADWANQMIEGNFQRLLDSISNVMRLEISKQLPPSTPATVTFRFVSEFLAHSFGRREKWECRNGFADSSGGWGGKREELFSEFPDIKSLSNAEVPRPLNHSYYFWFVLKDGIPKFCLDTEGRIFLRNGEMFDLAALYSKEKKIWPVIAQVALSELP